MSKIEQKHIVKDLIQRYRDLSAYIVSLTPPNRAVALVAVSKTHARDSIEVLLNEGHRVFAENRVQEALTKWPRLKEHYKGIELHLIGSLQTNKVNDALALFDVIETIDRPALIDAIAKERAKKPGRCSRFLIQVNTGEEPQKGGVSPEECSALYKYAREKQVPIEGLMCVPPAQDIPAPHFALLYKMAKSLQLPILSMGMSNDYPVAIRLGATHIRIGTALFGERETNP